MLDGSVSPTGGSFSIPVLETLTGFKVKYALETQPDGDTAYAAKVELAGGSVSGKVDLADNRPEYSEWHNSLGARVGDVVGLSDGNQRVTFTKSVNGDLSHHQKTTITFSPFSERVLGFDQVTTYEIRNCLNTTKHAGETIH